MLKARNWEAGVELSREGNIDQKVTVATTERKRLRKGKEKKREDVNTKQKLKVTVRHINQIGHANGTHVKKLQLSPSPMGSILLNLITTIVII
jgi:hypothetical protein